MPRGRRPGPPQPAPDLDTLIQRKVVPDLAHLAVTVATLRVQRKWTRQQLADRAQISNHVVTGIEGGTRDPNFTTVSRLLRTLGLNSLDLPEV